MYSGSGPHPYGLFYFYGGDGDYDNDCNDCKMLIWIPALCVRHGSDFEALRIFQPWSIQVMVFTLFSLRVSPLPT
jgi:hypothetical protein